MNAKKLVASMMVSALAIGTGTGALAADVNQDETRMMDMTYSVAAVGAKDGQVSENLDFIALMEGVEGTDWVPAFEMTDLTMAITIPDNLDDLSDADVAKLKADLEMNDEEFATFKAEALKNKAEFQQSGDGTEAFQMTEATLATAIPANLNELSDEELAKLQADLEMNDEEFAAFKVDMQNNKIEFEEIVDGIGTQAKATTMEITALNTAK